MKNPLPQPINITSLPEREMQILSSQEKLSLAKSLNSPFELQHLLVHQETLLPGRRASSVHKHSTKEEIFYILQGTPTIIIDGQEQELKAGDLIAFKPSDDCFHVLCNKSSEVVVFLSIGTNNADDVVEYK